MHVMHEYVDMNASALARIGHVHAKRGNIGDPNAVMGAVRRLALKIGSSATMPQQPGSREIENILG